MSEFRSGFLKCFSLLTSSRNMKSLYSSEFEDALRHYFGQYVEHEKFEQWWRDHLGFRVEHALAVFLPWLERHLPVEGKVILEIGCGTGSSTVALALKAKKVVAVDMHPTSLEVAKLRLREDGFADKVDFFQVGPLLEELKHFERADLVILYGVIEHMLPEERQLCIDRIWDVMEDGGAMVIYECPNRLWPKDIHTTGLWCWSWLPPQLALSYGKALKRFDKSVGLDQMYREGYGLTFFELEKFFNGKSYEFLEYNSREGGLRKYVAAILKNFFGLPRWALSRNLNCVIRKTF